MNLTTLDELLLKKLLTDVVLYQETFEEVYDHVVTALQERVVDGNLYTEAYKILEEDFGGYHGVAQMERCRKSYIKKDLNIKYMACLKAYLRNPLVLLCMLLLPVAVYYVCNVYQLSFVMPLVLVCIFACVPWCYVMVQKYRTNIHEKNYKDRILTETAIDKIQMPFSLSLGVLFFGYMFSFSSDNFGWLHKLALVLCGIAVAVIMLNFAIFFRVYFTEFKNNAAYDIE
ncbi:hypothetical protein KXQ82_13965 [Mucilaginibacter sp. HMF5004]|uniref:hypothetical protein n=1 Tax=Mucilaginibacter rivuli TaxID=2857527 RepID=UPI001C5ED28D|nr:hypothetical protein [Mucilaginibacter rivuli]MBW4890833.1 hypothetical protein [Mucilaginibacter rivuli]